ncbi:MAG: hypothetical protein ACYC6Y_04815 [Thermoguttaceae bacterium]
MGPISKRVARRFAKWSGHFRQEAKTIPIPKDVRDVGTLVKDGHDPLHAIYISVQKSLGWASTNTLAPEGEEFGCGNW